MTVKRVFAWILCALMLVGALPVAAFAAESTAFTDVSADDWFYEGVEYVYSHGMMNGTGDGLFSPEAATTRGMIVTILHRLEGAPAATGSGFTDVAAGQWYAGAVDWASSLKIVGGYGDGRFGPEDAITREQMAAILYRYAAGKGYDVSARADLSGYADADQISAYALESMAWANAAGLIGGIGDGILSPKGSATRAQAAVILMRFCALADTAEAQTTITSLHSLAADQVYFAASENRTVTFTVEADRKGSSAIRLVDDAGQAVAMYDNGRDGDAVAYDGVYSCRLTTGSATGAVMTYRAVAEGVESEPVVLRFFPTPTEEQLAKEETLLDELEAVEAAYTDENGYTLPGKGDEALAAVAESVRGMIARGEALYLVEGERSLSFRLASGIPVYYAPHYEGLASGGTAASIRVITLQPFLDEFSKSYKSELAGDNEELKENIINNLHGPDLGAEAISKAFSNYVFSDADNYDNKAVTLPLLRTLFGPNQVVIWDGHGGYIKEEHSMLCLPRNYTVWSLKDLDSPIYIDYQEGRIYWSLGYSGLALTYRFFEEYCDDLSGSFIFLGNCYSGYDDVLANTFLNKGAAAVIGCSDEINSEYIRDMQDKVLDEMTQINEKTGDYNTLEQALDIVKNKYGATDVEYFENNNYDASKAEPPAELLIFGDKSFRLASVPVLPPFEAVWTLVQNTATDTIEGSPAYSWRASAASGKDYTLYLVDKGTSGSEKLTLIASYAGPDGEVLRGRITLEPSAQKAEMVFDYYMAGSDAPDFSGSVSMNPPDFSGSEPVRFEGSGAGNSEMSILATQTFADALSLLDALIQAKIPPYGTCTIADFGFDPAKLDTSALKLPDDSDTAIDPYLAQKALETYYGRFLATKNKDVMVVSAFYIDFDLNGVPELSIVTDFSYGGGIRSYRGMCYVFYVVIENGEYVVRECEKSFGMSHGAGVNGNYIFGIFNDGSYGIATVFNANYYDPSKNDYTYIFDDHFFAFAGDNFYETDENGFRGEFDFQWNDYTVGRYDLFPRLTA